MFSKSSLNIIKNLEKHKYYCRPKASPGLWLIIILPLILIISAIKFPYATLLYKRVSLCSIGLLITSLSLTKDFSREQENVKKKFTVKKIILCIINVILNTYFFSEGGFFLNICSSIFTVFGLYLIFFNILKKFPRCFTYGEAFIVTQSVILFTYSYIINLYNVISKHPVNQTDIATLILQVGFFGIFCISLPVSYFKLLRKPVLFYIYSAFVILTTVIIPLEAILNCNPIMWIIELLTENNERILMIIYWVICCTLAILAVNYQVQSGKRANTVVRKIFHLLVIAVYIPGLLYECTLLYFSSAIIFSFLIVFEILRVLDIPPLNRVLQDGVSVYLDAKDSGDIALTHIYLLGGCSLPLWLHPAPCDVTDSAGFNLLPLLGGVLTVGVGDAAASVFGSYFGRHRWKSSNKTIEGTLACIFSQLVLVFLLIFNGFINYNVKNVVQAIVAITVTSLIEAKTDQIDNFVLPIVALSILL